MKIARFKLERRIVYGEVRGNRVYEIKGNIFGKHTITNKWHDLRDVKLLPPTDPVQCWGPGLNFADHLSHASTIMGYTKLPERPEPWHKGRNAVIGHEQPIVIPRDSNGDVHYEGELVAVIGKKCQRASKKDALGYVFGYTCGNDVSEREWQMKDRSFWRAKGSDTFAPVGPWIETELDPQNVDMTVKLNGKIVQQASTHNMLFDFATIISTISQQCTLYPGDLVFSGTTGNTSAMKPGDVVEVEMSGIGVLRNPVKG